MAATEKIEEDAHEKRKIIKHDDGHVEVIQLELKQRVISPERQKSIDAFNSLTPDEKIKKLAIKAGFIYD